MATRFLTDEEYAALATKATGDDATLGMVHHCRQVHRLLASGHNPADLTMAEQTYAAVFKGMTLVQVPNDYGWEPGIEEAEAAEAEAPEPESKPKKQKRSE